MFSVLFLYTKSFATQLLAALHLEHFSLNWYSFHKVYTLRQKTLLQKCRSISFRSHRGRCWKRNWEGRSDVININNGGRRAAPVFKYYEDFLYWQQHGRYMIMFIDEKSVVVISAVCFFKICVIFCWRHLSTPCVSFYV